MNERDEEEDTTFSISSKKVKVNLIIFITNDVYFNEYVLICFVE
jgi:hypothetical protein